MNYTHTARESSLTRNPNEAGEMERVNDNTDTMIIYSRQKGVTRSI